MKNLLCFELFYLYGKVSFLSLCFKNLFFVFNFQIFDYGVSWCGFLWAYYIRLMSLGKFKKLLVIISLNILLKSPPLSLLLGFRGEEH
jgi:hypothetical protein